LRTQRRAAWAIAAGAFLAGAALAAGASGNPVATTSTGKVEGRALPGGAGAVFKGLPFAQPPVGALRWREPQPVAAWKGVRDAGESKPPCAQNSSGWNAKEAAASQEDCLYLDVWTPQWPAKSLKPVMLWLHGGGNTGGAGASDPLYEGMRLIGHGVVLVIMDYRLGVFGFMAHPELTRESPHRSSGNYAFLDQIAALRWVQANIAKFGGDPRNVTVFGQSAGSMDLGVLMTSPLAKGLFHRAIAESGAAGRATPLADAERAGQRTADALKAPAEGALAYLRSLSTADLLKGGRVSSSANLDGYVFDAQPPDVFAAGKALPIPLLIGSNAIEMGGGGSPDALRATIQSRYRDLAPKALALYGLASPGDKGITDPLYGGPNDQWAADTGFRCPGILQGEDQAAAGSPVWEYQFDRAIPPKPNVTHSGELAYVFGNLLPTGSQAGEFVDADRKLSDAIQTYWTNFAKKGDPNGAGVPNWPKYDAASRRYMEFTKAGGLSAGENQRRAFCEVFGEAEKAVSAVNGRSR
jgi:para-nitrobenzyl esterase